MPCPVLGKAGPRSLVLPVLLWNLDFLKCSAELPSALSQVILHLPQGLLPSQISSGNQLPPGYSCR